MKKVFFKLLLRYPTQKYENLLALTENIYNNTEHSSLTSNSASTKKHIKFTPYRVHFDTHISSLVLRSRLKKYDEHQIKAKDSFTKLHASQKLSKNDKVRIKNEKRVIQKESGVFNPSIQKQVYEIESVDKKKFPYVFRLKNHPRTFYSWHLIKTSKETLLLENLPFQNHSQNKIEILSAIPQQRILRNRKSIDTNNYQYKILRNGKYEILSSEDLKFQKKIFGSKILKYNKDFFDKNPQLII